MKYKEKFEKYLKGELGSSEREEVDRDIEKMQVLFEYLDRELDEELLEKEDVESGAREVSLGKNGHTDLSREISRAVGRKLRKYTVLAGAVILILAFGIMAGLSPLLDAVCYNPAKQVEISEDGGDSAVVYRPFQLPLSVYMELFCGDKGFADVSVRPEGYGRYTIDVQTQINGEITHHPLELVRNHLYEQDMQWKESDIPANAFTYYDKENSCSIAPEEAKEKLDDLPDSVAIRAAVSFRDVKNMEELLAFMKKYEAQYLYIPIETNENGFQGFVGFCPKLSGYDLTKAYELYTDGKYPYLDLFEYEGDGRYPAEVLEQHVKSMIAFMMDEKNKRFLEIFDSSYAGQSAEELYQYKYRNIRDYIDAHGVNGYGAVVYASKQQLLEMFADETVSGVYMIDSTLQLN